jgi:hypothetical protein
MPSPGFRRREIRIFSQIPGVPQRKWLPATAGAEFGVLVKKSAISPEKLVDKEKVHH